MAYSDRSKGKGQSCDSPTQSSALDDNLVFNHAYAAPRTSVAEPWASLPQTYLSDQAYPPEDHYSLEANCQSASQPWSDDVSLSLSGLNISGPDLMGYTSNMSPGASMSAHSNWEVQSSAASSYAPSYAPSSIHPPPSTASTPPPRYNFDNVNTQINSQRPANQRYQLPCEVQGCNASFAGDEETLWIEHTEGFNCAFRHQFDSKSPQMGGDARYNFVDRMQHIRNHILDGHQPDARIPDGFLVEHLKKQGIIDEQTHRDWLKPTRVPTLVGGGRSGSDAHGQGSPSSSSRHHHRSQQKHLPMVEEEAGPSSWREYRTEKRSDRKEHRRDSHHSHHKKKPAK